MNHDRHTCNSTAARKYTEVRNYLVILICAFLATTLGSQGKKDRL